MQGVPRAATQRLRRRLGWGYRWATRSVRVPPDFLIIGTQKGGTTSLYEHLCSPPLVFRAQDKESHYFDWQSNYQRGLDWYRCCFPLHRTLERPRGAHG